MKNYNSFISILVFFYSGPLISQQVFDHIKAPSISLNGWVGKKPTSVEGKTIILEFWATWCGGCIEAIPHLNEMSRKYSSDSLLFISINSYDPKEKIERFLLKTPMETLIALDEKKATAKNFSVTQMPQTFLIDRNGYLRWHGAPGQVTDEFIQTFLKEDSILVPEIGNPLLYSLNISLTKDRSVSNISMTDGEKYGLAWRNGGVTDIVAQCYNALDFKRYEYRFEGTIPLEPALDVELRADSSISAAYIYNDLVQKMASMFDFSIVPVKENIEIWKLTIINEPLFEKAKQSNQDGQASMNENDKQVEVKSIEVWNIPGIIASQTEKIVEGDELRFEGKYDLILHKTDVEQLAKYLVKNYGLHLEKTIQEIEVK
ncbi:MAG: TlpA disulfide reductase family protein, partial [Saprospiraceae bacterium]